MPQTSAVQQRELNQDDLASLRASLAGSSPGRMRRILPLDPPPNATPDGDAERQAADRPDTAARAPAVPDTEAIAADLLRGIAAPGPAVTSIARQAAQAVWSVWNYTTVVQGLFDQASTLGAEATLATVERFTKLRDTEVVTMGRLLLTLDLLRDHEVRVQARVIQGAGRARRAHRRR